MPEFKGFAQRQGDDKEAGAAKVLVHFPDATKKIVGFDKRTGTITSTLVADPHQKAMGLEDLRFMIKVSPAGSDALLFFSEMEKKLIAHIESTISSVAQGSEKAFAELDSSVSLAT